VVRARNRLGGVLGWREGPRRATPAKRKKAATRTTKKTAKKTAKKATTKTAAAKK